MWKNELSVFYRTEFVVLFHFEYSIDVIELVVLSMMVMIVVMIMITVMIMIIMMVMTSLILQALLQLSV